VLSHSGSAQRQQEAQRAFAHLDLPEANIHLLDHPDRHLRDVLPELIQGIEHCIREYHIEVVFTHSNSDHHQDHRAVYEASIAAARNLGSLFLYAPTYPGRPTLVPFAANLVVSLSEQQLAAKLAAINEHRSQNPKYGDGVYLDFLRCQAVVAALQLGNFHGYAEAFQALRITW
jgi:LmbE family N-acetylglucosaminyl deacetylase